MSIPSRPTNSLATLLHIQKNLLVSVSANVFCEESGLKICSEIPYYLAINIERPMEFFQTLKNWNDVMLAVKIMCDVNPHFSWDVLYEND